MGYFNHHAIVVLCFDSSEKETKIHKKAKEIFGDLCSELIGPVTNGYTSFFIAPDGSKEGWNMSNEHDEKREEFAHWAQNFDDYSDVVEIHFGGDEPDINGIKVVK